MRNRFFAGETRTVQSVKRDAIDGGPSAVAAGGLSRNELGKSMVIEHVYIDI